MLTKFCRPFVKETIQNMAIVIPQGFGLFGFNRIPLILIFNPKEGTGRSTFSAYPTL